MTKAFPQLSENCMLNTLNFFSVFPPYHSPLPAATVYARISPNLGSAAAQDGRFSYFWFTVSIFHGVPTQCSSGTAGIPSTHRHEIPGMEVPPAIPGARGPLGSQPGCVTWGNCDRLLLHWEMRLLCTISSCPDTLHS